MGLDQYAVYAEAGVGSSNSTVFHTWRKHPNLHGWMFELYRKRGGTGDFNADDYVQLTAADLEELREVILWDNFATTTGFFFGKSYNPGEEGFEEQQKSDLKFVDDAVELIKQGREVYYTSWW